jgi:putative NIF3 family GTP cyclohydrolase 1 type 2
MKLNEIYAHFIKTGITADPRGVKEVEIQLETVKEKYDKLKKDEQSSFDKETLTNPYADTRIIHGNGNLEVKNVMVGIDIETPEILLADTLRKNGKKIDLIIAHHPESQAYVKFYDVINMQSEILHRQGVPINVSEKMISKRASGVKRSVLPQNHERVFDAARLLDIPLMTAHTVADNQVVAFLQKGIDKLKPRYIKDIIKFLKAQPEYAYAEKLGNGPFILTGSEDSRCGKVFVDMTGGTEGPSEALQKLADAGIGTMVCMHLSEKGFEAAEKAGLNVIIAGHIASDNLGMNLLFDSLEKKFAKLNFIESSGFRRFKR